jgi:type IV fimbrial biogenesis protein FimT
MPRSIQAGFTLIEVMVTVSLMALLVFMAAPTLSTFMENSKVRGVAEGFFAAAQVARAEAIRRNQEVELVMTTDDPTAANVDTTSLSATAGNWIVRSNDGGASPTYTFIEGKSVREGSGRSDGASTVGVNAQVAGAAQPSVVFRSAGSTSLGAQWQVNFTSSTAACVSATTPGPIRCLRVVVTPSGQVKSCDPAAPAGDSRVC